MAVNMTAAEAAHSDDPKHEGPHVVPGATLLGVFAALMALTYVTVAATNFDLGHLNLWIAMGIATVKASFVVLYFMHLRYDSPFNGFVFVVALAFVWLFLAFVMVDSVQYQPGINKLRLEQRQVDQ
jgi:cytochrome c oxidase subunit 4